ncbi:tetratricopeptide repeat protein [Pseudoalteromonas sp. C2R02]|uniref:tetratricopeptide repeat protein n=1 Tax=Pseudoalteromonas sp. C2R02 TaxID=2841565 RepID=UPI001C0994E6|nr:tetratricopeptide repeat protein [Pseudoalteromonas sp. C2R02]MBU2970997.1 tetratricopeptide repeat protein [Pseudoalteromonas sp. C2R02]
MLIIISFSKKVDANNIPQIEQLLIDNPQKALALTKTALKQFPKGEIPVEQSYFELNIMQIKALVKLGHFALATTKSHKLLQKTKHIKNKIWQARCLKVLGLIHQQQNNFAQSMEYFNQAETIFIGHKQQIELIELYTFNSRNYREQTQYKSALALLDKAYKIAEPLKSYQLLANIYNAQGVIYDYLGNFKQALEKHEQSFNLQKTARNQQGMANSLYNIGEIYRDTDHLDSALTYFTQALKIDIKLGDPRHIANSHSKLAQVYLSLNKLEIAYEHANKAVKIANKTGAPSEVSWAQTNLAKVLIAEKKFEEAENILQSALKFAVNSGAIRTEQTVRITLVELALEELRLDDAMALIDRALKFEDLGLTYKAKLNLLQSQAQEFMGEFKGALKSYQQYSAINNESELNHNKDYINLLKQNIELVRKDQIILESKNVQLQTQVQLEQYQLRWLLIIIVFVLCALGTVFIFWRQLQNQQLTNLRSQLADQKLIQKNQLLANVSHDLRTPLTILKLSIESLEFNLEPDPKKSYLNVYSKIDQLNNLIEDLYQSSQFDKQELVLNKVNINLDHLISMACYDFTALAESKGITISFKKLTKGKITCDIDAERTNQVIGNLIKNSINYTDPGGAIIASLKKADGAIYIYVDDTSPSLEPDEFEKVFDRHYRGDQSMTQDKTGSGLGLTICQQIISAHGGEISASKSELGGVKIQIVMRQETS